MFYIHSAMWNHTGVTLISQRGKPTRELCESLSNYQFGLPVGGRPVCLGPSAYHKGPHGNARRYASQERLRPPDRREHRKLHTWNIDWVELHR